MFKSRIDSYYLKHDSQRIVQGDLLRDINFVIPLGNEGGDILNSQVTLPYIIVISQDCDLFQGITEKVDYTSIMNIEVSTPKINFNQLIPSIIFSPAFNSQHLREGIHLKDLFNVSPESINSERWKLIKQNSNERYHFLTKDIDHQVPELVVDFKIYFTLPTSWFILNHRTHYLTTLNEIYREDFSRRFYNYHSRIALP